MSLIIVLIMNKSKQNNITKNILTLKSMDERMNRMEELAEARVRAKLAAELDELKASTKARRTLRSTLFAPFFLISTTILTNLHKIPLVGKLIKILGLWYGKSTWWQMLVLIRKTIIVTNALIGMYALIKVSGFSFDNIGAGIACFGATYLETLRNIICKIFYWFYDFFDYRTPNPPTEPGGSWWFKTKPEKDPRWWGSRMFGWYGKDMMGVDSISQPIIDLSKGQDFYNPFKARVIEEPRGSYFNPFNWSGWVWYTIFGVVSIGCAYYGYKWVMQEANAGLLRDWPPFGNWLNGGRGAAPAQGGGLNPVQGDAAGLNPVVEVKDASPVAAVPGPSVASTIRQGASSPNSAQTPALDMGNVLEGVSQKLQTSAVTEGKGIRDLAKSLSPLNITSATLMGQAEAAEIVRSVTPTEVAAPLISLPTPGPSEVALSPNTTPVAQDSKLSESVEPQWSVNNLLEGPTSYRITGPGDLLHAVKSLSEDLVATHRDPSVTCHLTDGHSKMLDYCIQRLDIYAQTIESNPNPSTKGLDDLLAYLRRSIPSWERAIAAPVPNANMDQLQTELTLLNNITQTMADICNSA